MDGEKGKNVIRKRPTINIDELDVNKNNTNKVVIHHTNSFVESKMPSISLKKTIQANANKEFITLSYFKSGDPTQNFAWLTHLTHVNVIRTKKLTDEFINVLLHHKDKIYLHFEISGMGKTIFEPNIPSVKESFFGLKKLIDSGFPQTQILVIINPILQNQNGLNALKLLLRVFSEFKPLRLRYARFMLLPFRQDEKGKFVIANNNILKRPALHRGGIEFLFKSPSFYKDYFALIEQYRPIIYVDNGEESLIGIRELRPFGYTNVNPDGTAVVPYKNGNKNKPDVKLLSLKHPLRCHNQCLLCPFKN